MKKRHTLTNTPIITLSLLLSILFLTHLQAAPWTPDDLGERIWLDWWAEDLPDGTVSSWTSREGNVSATQSSSSSRPTKQNGEVFFDNGDRLLFPTQTNAYRAHRAIAILFRIDLSGSGSGTIFTVNGAGGGYERQPMIRYNRDTNQVGVNWKTPNGYNSTSFTIATDVNQWHCLVSRRVGTKIYTSLDGKQNDGITPGETEIDMADWALPQENTSPTGYIGDFSSSTPDMAIDTVLILQDELSQADAEKLMGWAMWRRGVESELPGTHPYASQAPVSAPIPSTFVESTPAQYSALSDFWYDTDQSEMYKGAPMDLTGWELDFEDEFDTHSVTNDVSGRGTWFAPTHKQPTGVATAVTPSLNSSDPTIGTEGNPTTYIQNNSSMTIRMQNSGGWKSGAFCSVNSNGYGRTWMYPYVEIRMKAGNSSTGNNRGSWPALWLKSINCFYQLRETYMEYDIYEGYNVDPKGFHNSYHNWPGLRNVPGRLQNHRYFSNYLGLKTPGWHENVDLFDGQYHTYGVMVTPEWVINMFDGKEMFRFPTPPEMKQPLWVLFALGMKQDEVSQASGIYEMTVDYVRVYQNPAYSQLEDHVVASEDSYVRGSSYSNDNYGDEQELLCKYNTNSYYVRTSYIKFDLSSKSSVDSGKLILTPVDANEGYETNEFEVRLVTDDSWEEGAITWNNKPSTSTLLATIDGADITLGIPLEIDITSAVQQAIADDKTLSIAIVAKSSSNGVVVRFGSRESASPPRLEFPAVESTIEVDLESSADTYVRGGTYSNDSFGSELELYVKDSDPNYDRDALIQFDLSQLDSFSAAELVITPYQINGGGENGNYDVLFVSDDNWDESVTWNSAPADSNFVANIPGSALTIDEPYSIDITSIAQQEKSGDGTLSLKIVSTNASAGWILRMHSHEAGTGQPLLRATIPAPPEVDLESTADTYMRGGTYSDDSFGSELELLAKEDPNADYDRRMFIKFDLSNIASITSAELVVTPSEFSGGGENGNYKVLLVADNWDESTDWDSAPTGGTVIANIPGSALTIDQPYSIDVTSIAQQEKSGDGVLSLKIVSTNATQGWIIKLHSHEAGTGKPILRVAP